MESFYEHPEFILWGIIFLLGRLWYLIARDQPKNEEKTPDYINKKH